MGFSGSAKYLSRRTSGDSGTERALSPRHHLLGARPLASVRPARRNAVSGRNSLSSARHDQLASDTTPGVLYRASVPAEMRSSLKLGRQVHLVPVPDDPARFGRLIASFWIRPSLPLCQRPEQGYEADQKDSDADNQRQNLARKVLEAKRVTDD